MSKYTDTVENALLEMKSCSSGVCADCKDCYSDHGRDLGPESWVDAVKSGEVLGVSEFGTYGCDLCGTYLAGERHAAHYLNEYDGLEHVEVCIDCVMYLAYGDEPEEWEK